MQGYLSQKITNVFIINRNIEGKNIEREVFAPCIISCDSSTPGLVVTLLYLIDNFDRFYAKFTKGILYQIFLLNGLYYGNMTIFSIL